MRPPVHSQLDASVEMGRNSASLVSLTLLSRCRRARVRTTTAAGQRDAEQLCRSAMAIHDEGGDRRARGSRPDGDAGAGRRHARNWRRTGTAAVSQFTIDGTARIHGGAYRMGSVNASGITVDAAAHVTQDLIAVSGIRARFATGGTVMGDMRIVNWETPESGQTAKSGAQQGTIRTHVEGFTLDILLDTVAPRRFRRLGFDTPPRAQPMWTGRGVSIASPVRSTSVSRRRPTPVRTKFR